MLHIINQKKYLEAKKTVNGNFSIKVNDFFKDSSIYMNGIQDGIEKKDCLKIQSFACTMKNTADKFGAEKVSDIATKIESQAHSIMLDSGGDINGIKNLFGELEANFEASKDELKKLIN